MHKKLIDQNHTSIWLNYTAINALTFLAIYVKYLTVIITLLRSFLLATNEQLYPIFMDSTVLWLGVRSTLPTNNSSVQVFFKLIQSKILKALTKHVSYGVQLWVHIYFQPSQAPNLAGGHPYHYLKGVVLLHRLCGVFVHNKISIPYQEKNNVLIKSRECFHRCEKFIIYLPALVKKKFFLCK